MRDYERAIREVSLSHSEIRAFLDFRDSLTNDFGVLCQCWDEGHEPPDYYLWADGRKIGVEVTTLAACERVLHANDRVDKVLQFLRQEVSTIEASEDAVVMVSFEPDSDSTIPDPRRTPDALSGVLDRLRCLRERPVSNPEKIPYNGGRFWLEGRPAESGRIDVKDQGFFDPVNHHDWFPDVNEAIARKVNKYLSRDLYKPCWLLLNLKPYLPGAEQSRQFISERVPVSDAKGVRRVFKRVYAVTQYISHVGRGPYCPVVQLL